MVNGEEVDGADIVLWYNAHFEHVVRDEDELNMPAEHMGLELRPRSWRKTSPFQYSHTIIIPSGLRLNN